MGKTSVESGSILICLDGFKQGGTQQAFINILPDLTSKFSRVYVLIIQKSERDLELPNLPNLISLKFDSKRTLDLNLFISLFFLLRRDKPKLILSSMFRSNIFMALFKSKKSKLFWMEQNTYFNRTSLQWFIMKKLSTKVDKIICISNDVANLTRSKLGKRIKFCVIPNPVSRSIESVKLSTKKNDFVFIGRLTEQKQPLVALEAFSVFLKKYNEESYLHIVGEGELLINMKERAKKLDIYSRCVFHGFVSNADVYALLSKTKTLISTSKIEGLAMVRFEALALGNCIVTTNSGGTDQFFSRKSNLGVFISGTDSIEFSTRMLETLRPEFWSVEMINSRIKIIKKFNSENFVNSLLLEYLNLRH